VSGAWRRLTGTRTMRSAATEFGPPPGARYALPGLSDLDVIRYGHEILAARQFAPERARDRVAAARSRAERLGASPQRPVRTAAVAW
jgi:hypothetical protein